MYQELASGIERGMSATSLTCSTQASSASAVGLDASRPRSRRCAMQSAIQSTCCSIDTTMLLSTDGLPGPVIVNRFGKPAIARPR